MEDGKVTGAQHEEYKGKCKWLMNKGENKLHTAETTAAANRQTTLHKARILARTHKHVKTTQHQPSEEPYNETTS